MSQRLNYIDELKGLSILCITLLHYESGVFPNWLNTCIGIFMITAFYFTSGYVQGVSDSPVSVGQLCRKRLSSLGIPYFWFTLLILSFDIVWVAAGFYDWRIPMSHVFNAVTLRGIGTLWFLPVLFFGEVIFTWLRNKNNLLLTFLAFFCTMLYLHYYYIWQGEYRNLSDFYRVLDAPFHILSRVLSAWPIIGIGYLVGKFYHRQLVLLPQWLPGVAGIALSLFLFWNLSCGPLNLGEMSFVVYPAFLPLGLMLCFMSLNGRWFMNSFFSFWGRNSLILMLTHYSILLEICKVLNEKLWGEVDFTGIHTLYFFAATILVEYPIVWIVNRKFNFLIGK